MQSEQTPPIRNLMRVGVFIVSVLCIMCLCVSPRAFARSAANPQGIDKTSFQNLVYSSSTPWDVQQVMGPPDEVIKSTDIYPMIENHVYYEEGGTGNATIMVFQNNLLVGMHYKTPNNQLVDLTYFLLNNGDGLLNRPALAGYRRYVLPYEMLMFEW